MLRTTVLVLLTHFALAQAPRYTVHDLGPINNGAVRGINIKGQVIGYDTLPDSRVRSFRTAPNAPINWATDDLGSFGGASTRAFGINASGQVVGGSALSTGELRGFRTAANKPIQPATDNIGTLNGQNTQAIGINDVGQVTGNSGEHAFLTAPNRAIDPTTDDIHVTLTDQQTYGSTGIFVNNQGHVLGQITLNPGSYMAFLHTNRISEPLPDVRRYIEIGFAGLTEQDQLAFNFVTDFQLWQKGRKTLLRKCSDWCIPSGVNNSFQVVGTTATNPFLYSNGVFYDLTTLIPAASSPGGLRSLVINDLGQIAGIGTVNNETHAIRLDPIPSVSDAIQQTLTLVNSLPLDRRIRGTLPLMLRAALASKLKAALDSWNSGNPAATRGLLNEFENIVRAHTGKAISTQQADRLLEMAEAAIALT